MKQAEPGQTAPVATNATIDPLPAMTGVSWSSNSVKVGDPKNGTIWKPGTPRLQTRIVSSPIPPQSGGSAAARRLSKASHSFTNATRDPSSEIDGSRLSKVPLGMPSETRDSGVLGLSRSHMYTSASSSSSSGSRLVASDVNTTHRPSAEMSGSTLSPLPGTSSPAELTRVTSTSPLSS